MERGRENNELGRECEGDAISEAGLQRESGAGEDGR